MGLVAVLGRCRDGVAGPSGTVPHSPKAFSVGLNSSADGSGMGLTACRIGEVEARLGASGTVVWLAAGQAGSFRESVPFVSGCQRHSA